MVARGLRPLTNTWETTRVEETVHILVVLRVVVYIARREYGQNTTVVIVVFIVLVVTVNRGLWSTREEKKHTDTERERTDQYRD